MHINKKIDDILIGIHFLKKLIQMINMIDNYSLIIESIKNIFYKKLLKV